MTAPPSRAAAAYSLLAFIAAFIVLRAVLLAITPALHGLVQPSGLREETAFRVGMSFVLGALCFAAVWTILKVQKLDLRTIGWGAKARWPGWLAAFVVAALFIAFTSLGPMFKGAPWATDWSLFRVGCAVTMAVIGGVFEESIYRGFVIDRAKALGLNTPLQVILSGLLFGLAHAGWGGLGGGQFALYAAIGAMVSTGVLGLLLAIAYVLGGRSLTPTMTAHAVINLAVEPWLLMYAMHGGFGHR
jgi:hypothetical protein